MGDYQHFRLTNWLSPDHKCVHGHLELKVEWKFFISNKKSGRKIHFLMSQMDQLKIENLILYNYKEKCGKTYKQEEESTEGVYLPETAKSSNMECK